MLLAVDIGNTNIVFGCVDDNDEIVVFERISTNHNATSAEYAVLIRNILEMNNFKCADIHDAIMSSVVPSVTNTVKEAIRKLFKVNIMVAGPGVKTGLNILIDNPRQLGSDQAVDAVAAINEYPTPLIVIDMGTATTVSVISGDCNYVGGMIIPGLWTSMNALSANAAQLPYIDLNGQAKLLGTNTVDCMRAGAVIGTASMLDGIIGRLERQLGEPVNAILTGGLSSLIAPYCEHEIHQEEDLLIDGLKILYEMNKK
jgi:type III pantothenate kinase